jgi:catechol 2,3-dioxygenase-like lactoylglutathione lyase family enzyme
LALAFQVTFDCADPDKLARFWAEVLGYKLADPPPGFATWDAFLETVGVPEEKRKSASAIVDPDGSGPRLFFQKVPEPKSTKNRVHLDLRLGGGTQTPIAERKALIDAAVERLVALGATVVGPVEEYGQYCVVLRDPEGNEFCADGRRSVTRGTVRSVATWV